MRLYAMMLRLWLTALLNAAMPSVMPNEQDHPPGHPARHDYNPKSPEAKEWARRNIHPKGERDFPVDHPKALDTKGNTNSTRIEPGVDPNKPELEAFTGRTPEQAKAVSEMNQRLAKEARESLAPEPIEAPEPPPPGDISEPTGQPGVKGERTRVQPARHKRK